MKLRKNKSNKQEEHILSVTRAEQYKTIDELFKRSHPTSVYYTLLILSIFIVASGLLLENAFIVLGGMLVTPVLTPVLVIGLGFAVGELRAIKYPFFLLVKSVALIVAISFFLAFLLGAPSEVLGFDNTLRTAILYFVVAVASGVGATFAWVRREVADVLPGVAIAVALVPPLSLVGIWMTSGAWEPVQFYFLVFLFNLFGIVMGSLVVFALLKFYKTEKRVGEKADEAEKEAEKEK